MSLVTVQHGNQAVSFIVLLTHSNTHSTVSEDSYHADRHRH